MFAKFIYTSFPIVIVKFSRDIENTEDFDDFLKKRPEGKPFCFWFGGHAPHRVLAQGIRLSGPPGRAWLPSHAGDVAPLMGSDWYR